MPLTVDTMEKHTQYETNITSQHNCCRRNSSDQIQQNLCKTVTQK